MNPYLLAALVAVPCLVLPTRALVLAAVAGVMLADTRLVPRDYIFLTRFVPMGVLCFRALAHLAFRKAVARERLYVVKSWLPFLGLALFSTIYSEEALITFQRALSGVFVLLGFGAGIPVFLSKPEEKYRTIRQLSVLMAVAVLYALATAPAETPAGVDPEQIERLRGVFVNPNTLGLLAMQAFFVLVYWWQMERERLGGKILLGALVGIVVALVASGSRASMAGFLIGLLVFVWGTSRFERRRFSVIWSVGLILGSAFLIVGFFLPEFSGGILRAETASRTVLWERALQLSRESPYIGVGFGGSDGIFAQDAAYLREMGIYVAGPHSSLGRLLVDLGWVGVAVATAAFFVLVRRAWKFLPRFQDSRLGLLLLAAVAGSLVNAFFESWLFGFGSASTVPFWFMLALLSHQADQADLVTALHKHGRKPRFTMEARRSGKLVRPLPVGRRR